MYILMKFFSFDGMLVLAAELLASLIKLLAIIVCKFFGESFYRGEAFTELSIGGG